MNIKTKIDEITGLLKWRLEHEHGHHDLEITSDPWTRTHIIKMPTGGADWRDIEYLHELAHAVLAERHHLLATAYFTRDTHPTDIKPLIDPCRIASDWYADELLVQWAPDEESAQIKEHADLVRQYPGTEREMIYGGGLCLAQVVQYLGDKRHAIPRRYRAVADILLGADPGKPTVATKRGLVNALAALTCRQRVHLTHEDGMDVWRCGK